MTEVPVAEVIETWSENYASHSQLTTHRACPQRWFYGTICRYSEIETEPAVWRDFGSWWHTLRAADSIDRGREHGSLKKVPRHLNTVDGGPQIDTEGVTPTDVYKQAIDWWAKMDPDWQKTWVDLLGEPMPERLWNLYLSWYRRWSDDIETEEPMAVEFSWRRQLPDLRAPQGGWVEPDTVLIGYVDEIYFDTKRNMVVVRDHKAAKTLATQTTADDMMDSQLQLYAWGAAPTVAEWARGQIKATAYDRSCMIAPKPPALTQSGRLSVRDGKPSLGQTDLYTYLGWAAGEDGQGVPYPGLKKDGSGAGLYVAEQSVIETLSSPQAKSVWFQRTLTPLNSNIVRAHLRAAVDSAVDMALSRARAGLEGEAARNLSAGCRWCFAASLCRAQLIGGPEGEYLLADHGLTLRPG